MAIRFGAFTFDSRLRELRRDGVPLPLSPKAFRLLELLVEARPQPISREALYARLWPDVVVEPGNLHGVVAEVRSALGDGEHQLVRTVHRVGYAFTAAAIDECTVSFSLLVGDDEIPLRAGENMVGRDRRDTVVIRSPEVSRHHARLVVTGGVVTLEDLGSKNGTYVGTQRVTGVVEIFAGDELLIGTVKARLVRSDASLTTATAG